MKSKSITVNGITYPSINAAAKAHGLKPITVHKRLKKGWSIEQAFSQQSQRHKPITIGGKLYRSIEAAAKAGGVSAQAFMGRINRGWTKEQAIGLDDPPDTWNPGSAGRTITVSGKTYKSISDAARAYDLDHTVVTQRLNAGGWSINQAFEIDRSRLREGEGRGSIYIITNTVNGKQYVGITLRGLQVRLEHHFTFAEKDHGSKGSLQDAIRKHGREAFTIELLNSVDDLKEMRRLERLYIKELNTMRPTGYNVRPGGEMGSPITKEVTVAGRKFKSIADLCRHYDIDSGTFQSRLRRGWSLEQAVSLEPPPVTSLAKSITVDGQEFQSQVEAAKFFGINGQTFRNRMDRGWTPEQAADLEQPPTHQAAGSKAIQFQGKTYPSHSALARAFGISFQTFKTRRRRGLSIAAALGLEE